MVKNENRLPIEPKLLKWARKSMGMSPADLAFRLKKSVQEVIDWEAGISSPTYIQLEQIAYDILKRPIAVFFLEEPPEEKSPKVEFRTLPEHDIANLHSDTFLHIRKAHFYQVCLSEIFGDASPIKNRLIDEVVLRLGDSPESAAKEIRANLGISIENQIQWGKEDIALKKWRQSVEARGIFVFKDTFKEKEISGFCLQDNQFPVIYLNNSTTKTRQIFSLLHELAHLLFKVNGLSKFGSVYIDELGGVEGAIEVFCNKVASEVLIPSSDFIKQIQGLPQNLEALQDQVFSEIASRYGVSREAILRKALDQGRVSKSFYELKASKWNSQKTSGKGGDWYLSKNAYLSEKYSNKIVSLKLQNILTKEQASEFLGIKPKTYDGLESRILKGVHS